MKFSNTPPIWEEKGVEPTEELQKKGFLAGYKPPAAYFNYLFNRLGESIKEMQASLSNIDNTADVDKPTSTAQQASINAMLISGNGYGKNVGIADSAAAPFNALSVLGASKQQTTTGKNLFSTSLESGLWAFTSKIKNPNPDYVMVADFIGVEPNTTYVFSGTAINNFRGNLAFYDESQNYIDQIFAFNAFTTPENAHYILFHVTAEDTSNINGTVQLEVGTTATSYEPYTGGIAAPNPEYPQDINSVGDNGSVVVRATRKNMFQVATGTQNGVTLSKKDDYYVLNGTCTGSHNFVFGLPYELEAGTYTISANNPKNNGIEFHLIDVHSSSLNETLGIYDNANYNQKTRQLQGGKYSCRVRIENGVTYDNFIFKPQLERGSAATSYEPYTETVTEVPLSTPLYGIPVTDGGNYTDKSGQQWCTDEIDAARGVYVQRLATTDLSTLTWSVAMNWWQATIEDICYPATNIEYGVALAEYYRLRIASGMSTAAHGEFAIDTTNIKVDNGSTTEQPKGLLVYKLAEPIETPLSTEQLAALFGLRCYEGYNNVSTDDIGELSLEYFRSTYNGKAAATIKQGALLSNAANTGFDDTIAELGATTVQEAIVALKALYDSINIKYVNTTEDMVQLKDAAGVWHDYASGGLQVLDLLTLNAGDWTVSGSATTTFTVNPFTLTSADKNGATSQTSSCKTKDTYDLTGKTKLEIVGSGWHVTFGSVQFINAETGLTDYKYTRASGSFNEIITLPNLNGKYYIALNSGVYGGAGNTKVTMNVFRLTV